LYLVCAEKHPIPSDTKAKQIAARQGFDMELTAVRIARDSLDPPQDLLLAVGWKPKE
jgi:hypothetical protein